RAAVRDHYGSIIPPRHLTPAEAHYFTVCMHAEPVGTTTASMIARIAADPDAPLTYWASLGSSCIGAFIPLSVDVAIPSVLTRGGEQPSDDSAWWRFKRLLSLVERDWERHAPAVRRELDAFEATMPAQPRPAAEREAFMRDTVTELLARVDRLIAS